MKTNEMKKGTHILLRNGWEAVIEDNAKGNTRLCTVFGDFEEMGSVYSHDIVGYAFNINDEEDEAYEAIDMTIMGNGKIWRSDIEYTPSQLNCKQFADSF